MMVRADSRLVHELYPAANFEPRRQGMRPSILILHYTGVASAAKAIDWLSRPDSRVSCHYVIDEAGGITQMVAEAAIPLRFGSAQSRLTRGPPVSGEPASRPRCGGLHKQEGAIP